MKQIVCLSSAVIFISVLNLTTPVRAQWQNLKKFIHKDVKILQENENLLFLYHADVQDTLVIHENDAKKSDCDIYGALEQKRGGNPYRVWVATKKFWNNHSIPKKNWGKYFRSEFLILIRAPRPGATND